MNAAQWLSRASRAVPAADAQILLEHVTKTARHQTRALTLSSAQVERLDELARRRADGTPVQYLTGEAPFRHLVLSIGSGALIPRPETELLVELALAEISRGARTVVDLGAGSGAIAIAIATESVTPVAVTAVEREPEALAWLQRNVEQFAPAIHVIASDVIDLCLDQHVDLVVANPPYLPADTELPIEVADHEPGAALWGGGDGTEVPLQFIRGAEAILRPDGMLLMEHSDRHQDAIVELLVNRGWRDVQRHSDLTRRPRFVQARYRP